MTDPPVAPLPRRASGMSARCGWMNGSLEVVCAGVWADNVARMIEVWQALRSAVGLDPALFAAIAANPLGQLWPAFGVALLAAASTMLGHVAILLLNRISGWRLLTSLLLSAAALALLRSVQVLITWLVASLVLGRPLPVLPLLVVGLVSMAPQVFNFITALPHLGILIAKGLEVWSAVVLILGVAEVFNLHYLWAAAYCLAGWGAMQLLERIAARPVNWAASRLWSLATGSPTMVTAKDLLAGTPVTPVSAPAEVAR